MERILVTGGAGYIGSHICVELQNAGYEVVVYDNFSNSRPEAIRRVEQITSKKITFVEGDVREEQKLILLFRQQDISATIHLAGLKAVGESNHKPLDYYDNNIQGTLCLIRAMQATNIKKLVFSSSATVYGIPKLLPISENHPLSATNPYGKTKLFIEEILRDLYLSDPKWMITILRYFNPVGAHESGFIGEDPRGIPNNLMPLILQVAIGRRETLNIYGSDYQTRDGTGVRDYIHVVDLAIGHIEAMSALQIPQCIEINLGTGRPYSVLEVIEAFEHENEVKIAYEFVEKRLGDVAECFANPKKAYELLGWQAKRSLKEICADAWRFQLRNPEGLR